MDKLPFNVVDIAVVGVILLSALLAYARGAVHEVLSIGAWIGAVVATIYGAPFVKPYARSLIPAQIFADLVAGAAIFILTLVVLSLITRILSSRVKGSALGALDRALGFLFGILRGALLVVLAYIALNWALPRETPVVIAGPGATTIQTGKMKQNWPTWLLAARAMPVIETGARVLKGVLPKSAAQAAKTGGDAANNLREKTQKLLDAQKILKDAITPTPKNSGANKDPVGYGARSRSEMDRLFDNNQ
ncbi:CvpA family protein [Varunaivibrio sulfuroxidans]|uniref:Membrane protein required for colicin V production n=1 Tax=Varunaivibrio sulfuroxidans TaxID=1773489 RepID=A0A4R3J2U5_9PROT|nr:CvpA family protein [Varunaivibrio sulfuroxidans]TCS60139.1 membrane protein required for colicin V production [Varunaivibrio sulfuroxidans]WES30889.1 CvpA family protein [Varunaivibrio sulfuroxidans]